MDMKDWEKIYTYLISYPSQGFPESAAISINSKSRLRPMHKLGAVERHMA